MKCLRLKKINDVKESQEYTVFNMIENNDIKALKKYIKEDRNINKTRYVIQKNCLFGKGKRIRISLLYQAIYMGNFTIINLLLENNIYINDRDAEALAKSVV